MSECDQFISNLGKLQERRRERSSPGVEFQMEKRAERLGHSANLPFINALETIQREVRLAGQKTLSFACQRV
jgi:hypothetical protein